MFWVVQDNIFSEAGHEALLQALETGHIDYVLCRFLPHTHKLVPHDLDLSQYENTDQMPEIQVPQNRLIMVCGATLMNVVAGNGAGCRGRSSTRTSIIPSGRSIGGTIC